MLRIEPLGYERSGTAEHARGYHKKQVWLFLLVQSLPERNGCGTLYRSPLTSTELARCITGIFHSQLEHEANEMMRPFEVVPA